MQTFYVFAWCVVALRTTQAAVGTPTGGGRSSSAPYSYSLTTFDPAGRLQQLEFALRSVDSKPAAVAVVTEDGVVVAKWSAGSSKPSTHVCLITESIALTYAGSEADFRSLARRCVELAIEHVRDHGVEVTIAGLADDLSGLVQEHTQVAGLRPFGCSLLLVGRDDYGLEAFKIDASGWVAPWRATAVGKHAADIEGRIAAKFPRTVQDTVQLLREYEASNGEEGRGAASTGGTPTPPRGEHGASLVVIRGAGDGAARIYGDLGEFDSASL